MMWIVTWSEGGRAYRALLHEWTTAIRFVMDTPGLPKARVMSAATWHREHTPR